LRTGLELLKLDPSPELVARTKATMERQITNLALINQSAQRATGNIYG